VKEWVITGPQLRHIFEHLSEVFSAEEAHLIALDSAIGDGDHGITMRLGFQAVQKELAKLPPDVSVEELWTYAGKTFMRSTGGAMGVLLGRAFCAAGAAMTGAAAVGPAELRAGFAAMEKAVANTGKAQPGDKTILDALHAANTALAAAEKNSSVSALLQTAAEAAQHAALATAGMHCRTGRASKLGDRALGHADPGATSFSILVRTMAEEAQVMAPSVAGTT
jgi:phosphoenolpyruvate---glycerone phosphotransferase subunit DhaL